jgi:hypothetical protein
MPRRSGDIGAAVRLDVGDDWSIGLIAGSGVAVIVEIGLARARIDLTLCHDDDLLFQFGLPISSSKTRIERPDRGRRGKSARHAREQSDELLRRRPRMGQIALFLPLDFRARSARRWWLLSDRREEARRSFGEIEQ